MPTDEFAEDAQESVQEGESSLPETLPSSGTLGDDESAELRVDWKAQALKYKAIVDRHKEKGKAEPSATAPAPTPAPDAPLTRQDLYRINSRKAMELVKADPEMAPFLEDIRSNYVNRRGQEDPADILEDCRDAYFVVKARKPQKEGNPVADLQTFTPRPSARPPVTQGRQTQPLRKRTQSMNDWYKKPE